MNLPTARTSSWRYLFRGIVALLCVWAGVLAATGATHAAEHPIPLHRTSSLSTPDDKNLATVIGASLSMATVRSDMDRGSLKPVYLAAPPQNQTRLGLVFQSLERAPSLERFVFHRCCITQAGGTRAPPVSFPFPCLLSL